MKSGSKQCFVSYSLMLSAIGGCYSGADAVGPAPGGLAPAEPVDGESIVPEGTSLLVQVVTPTQAPIARATVTLITQDAGEVQYARPAGPPIAATPGMTPGMTMEPGARWVTDSAGHALLEGLPPGRVVARVDAPGYTSGSVVLALPEGAHAGRRLTLLPLGEKVAFEVGQGASIERGDVRVEIAADAVVDATGTPVTGLVELSITPLDSNADLMRSPWPLFGQRPEDGAVVDLESFYMADLTLWRGGEALQLAPDRPAMVAFRLPPRVADRALGERFAAGDVIPSWYYDFTEGAWIHEGEGLLTSVADDPDRLAWTTYVQHFSPHNCDQPPPPKPKYHCVFVTVYDDQAQVLPNVHVIAEGVSYQGFSEATTDDQGQACLQIQFGGTVDIYAGELGQPISEEYEVVGQGPDATCGQACTPLNVKLPPGKGPQCEKGEIIPCPYAGPPSTKDIGLCKAGAKTCDVDAQWTACIGEVTPADEVCNTDLDEDCDGAPYNDEGGCACNDGDANICYTGPAGTYGVGACVAGFQICVNNQYEACKKQVTPVAEDCATLDVDEDCDGNAGCGEAVWALGLGDAAMQAATGVAVGAMGQAFAVGRAQGVIELGNYSMQPGAKMHGFVVQVSAKMQPKALVDLGAELASDLRLAGAGAGPIVLAGTGHGVVTAVNCGPVVADAEGDVVVARLNADAQCESIVVFPAAGAQRVTALAVQGSRVAVAGTSVGSIAFDADTALVTASPIGFVAALVGAQLDSVDWAQVLPAGPVGGSVAVDVTGGVLVAGSFTGAADLAGELVAVNGVLPDYYLGYLDPVDGVAQWATVIGTQANESGATSVALGPDGRIAFAAELDHVVSLFGAQVGIDDPGMLLVELDANLQLVWQRSIPARLPAETGGGLVYDSAGRLVLAAGLAGPWEGLDTAGTLDVLIAKFNTAGGLFWAHNYGSDGADERANAAAIGPDDEVLVAGQFAGALQPLDLDLEDADDVLDAFILSSTL